MGFRGGRPILAAGLTDGAAFDAVFPLCTLGLAGQAQGIIIGAALDPQQMLDDQDRAMRRMMRGAALARAWAADQGGALGAVGLGSLCAVVAGRGTALAEQVPEPVTTGGAATAWALWQNTRAVAAATRAAGRDPGPIAVLGARSPVGTAVAALLVADGEAVRLDNRRAARAVQGDRVTVADGPAAAAAGCDLVVGAGPTGAMAPASALKPGAVVIDVAIPATFTGPRPPGVIELAGEALSLPEGWERGFWGRLYHLISGYGPRQVFACLVEPLVLAVEGRTAPFALGRRLDLQSVRDFGRGAERLGFGPRLARGWWAVTPERVVRRP